MTTNALLLAAFSIMTPVIVSYLKQQSWPAWAKVLCALGVSVLCGGLSAWVNGLLAPGVIGQNAVIIFTAATVFYEAYFKYTGLNDHLERM